MIDTEKISEIVAVVALLGTIAASAAVALEQINPRYAVICLAISGAASAFTKRVQAVKRRRKFPKNFTTAFLLVALLGQATLTTACDSRIKRAVNSTARVAAAIDNLVNKNRESMREGIYDRRTAMRIVNLTAKMIPAARAYTAAVDELRKKYSDPAKIPRSEFNAIYALFDAVYAPFLEALEIFKVLSAAQKLYIESAIIALQELFATIRGGFSDIAKNYMGGAKLWTI